jgi:hypothetical protein
MARYSRTGFEAAAVTAMAARVAARIPARHRVAELRFAHPYAVVAIATDPAVPPADRERYGAGGSPWRGVPVFSAWVSAPDDADADDDVPAGKQL